MMTKPKRNTLERQRPSIWEHELVVKISFTTLIFLLFLLFVIICYLITPMTYGFFTY